MWKDWLERTLTRNKVPVMLASEITCLEPANGNEYGPWRPREAMRREERAGDLLREPVEAQ
jgi:hypothetical protein